MCSFTNPQRHSLPEISWRSFVYLNFLFIRYPRADLSITVPILKKLFKKSLCHLFMDGLQSQYEETVYFLPKFPGVSDTHFIDLGRMKGWVDLGSTQWFWTWDSWIGNPATCLTWLVKKDQADNIVEKSWVFIGRIIIKYNFPQK